MSWKRIKAWSRLIGVILVLFLAFLVVFMNRNNRTNLWLFHDFQQVAVIWLMLVTAAVCVIGCWVVQGVYRAYRDVRQPAEKPEKK
jgi:hypothetical protein